MAIKYLNTTKTSYLDGDVLYSYTTPVARIVGSDLIIDDVYYSHTTSKQITLCARRFALRKVYQQKLF